MEREQIAPEQFCRGTSILLLYGSGAESSTFEAEQYLAAPSEWSWERSGAVSFCSMVVGASGAQKSSFEAQ